MNQLRYDLLQLALQDMIEAEMPGTATTVWASQVPARGQYDFATMNLIAGPTNVHRARRSGRSVELPATVTLTVTTLSTGTRVYARVNGVEFYTDAAGGDTIELVRNRLLALMNGEGGTDPDVVATAASTNAILLTPAEAGGLWAVAVFGTIGGVAASLDTYDFSSTTKRLTVNIQTFGRATSPRSGASFHINNIIAALERASVLRSFEERDIGVWGISSPIPSNILVGTSSWESRSSVDVDFALRSVKAELVGSIDNLSTTIEGRLVTNGSVVHTDTFTTP